MEITLNSLKKTFDKLTEDYRENMTEEKALRIDIDNCLKHGEISIEVLRKVNRILLSEVNK